MKTATKKPKIQKKTIKKMTPEEFHQSMMTTRLTPQRMVFQPRQTVQNYFLRRVILIKNFPTSIDVQCLLSKLSQFKNTSFSMRIEPMAEGKAAGLIDRQINNKRAVFSRSNKTTDQINAETEEKNIKDFYRQLQDGHNKIYLCNIFVEFYGETEEKLITLERKIKNLLQGYKVTCEVLTYEQKEGFIGTYPLGKDLFKKSANNIPSNTLASLYPFSYSNRTDQNGLFLGETVDGGYVFLDLDARNETITTGNYSILGASGQGKTWLQQKILSQEIFKGTTVLVLDPDKDYITMVSKLGGTVINCADGRIKINPFEVRRMYTDDTIETVVEMEDPEIYAQRVEAFREKAIFFQHLSWLKEFFLILFPNISQREINALMILTQGMYYKCGINENTDFDKLLSHHYPVFSDLYNCVDDVFNHYEIQKENIAYKMISKELLRDLLLLLQDTHNGSLGYLLNGHTNIRNDKIICFDVNDLYAGSRDRMQAIIFNVMTYIWNRIAMRKEHILFCVDELGLLLNKKNPVIVHYLRDFAKRIRKYGSKLGTATQNLDDYNDPEIQHLTKPIFANTSFKFLFHPDKLDLKIMQDMLKLTDGEAACIAEPKMKHCLLKAGSDKYYFKVGELSYEKELFGKLSAGEFDTEEAI